MRALLLVFLFACKSTAGWTAAAPLFPERQGHAVVTNGTFVFSVGGLSPAGTAIDLLSVYNPGNNTWSPLAELPLALHHPIVCALGDDVFVLGGLTESGSVGACFRHTLSTNSWANCAPGVDRGAAACAVANGRIYVIGGLRGDTALSDAQEYDPASDTWRELPPLPVARHHMGAVAFANQLHVIGGRSSGLAPTGRVDIFDLTTETWSEGPSMGVARSDYAMSTDGSQALIFGGEGNGADPLGMFAAVERYDGNSFTRLEDMPRARHGAGAAYVSTPLPAIYLPGGGEVAGLAPTSLHERLAQ